MDDGTIRDARPSDTVQQQIPNQNLDEREIPYDKLDCSKKGKK